MKPSTAIASVLLAIVALAHLQRFIQACPVSVSGMLVPVLASEGDIAKQGTAR